MTHSVYHLVDPVTHVVRYVGKTKTPKSRLNAHIKESLERQNTDKKAWIFGLHQQGLKPVMVVVGRYIEESMARIVESEECKKHLPTIFNIHDPAKGAGDFRRGE